jgi:hypothetical protein
LYRCHEIIKISADFSTKTAGVVSAQDVYTYFSIQMSFSFFSKFYTIFQNMHPSARTELIRIYGSSFDAEYQRLFQRPAPEPLKNSKISKLKQRSEINTITNLFPSVFTANRADPNPAQEQAHYKNGRHP